MKQGLQLKLSQQLTMTPQLQQAIRLLQLSTLELQQEIQLALDSNPLLELPDSLHEVSNHSSPDEPLMDTREALSQQNMSEDLPVDATWNEIYSADISFSAGSDYNNEELPVYQGETTQTLQDYLLWQMTLTPFSELETVIATTIIDAIDDTGYLTTSLDDLEESIGDKRVTISDIESVLTRIQHFDPVGIGARDLRECLMLQLSQLSKDTPFLQEAKLITQHHLELLGNHDFRTVMRHCQLKEPVLKSALQLIRTLEPKPGNSINTKAAEYIIPDVLLYKIKDQWVVELNPDSTPKLKINAHYASMSRYTRNPEDTQFIRNNLQEAKWLIKSLESRNDTLLKVTRCIVEQQQEFFDKGEEFMKPMVLADIAQAVEMHESTISRVTTQKYLHTPKGIFELKYFFSSHINTEGGGEASSTAIRALVKRFISAENPAKPLSDSKIATLLVEQGLIVARRTVAKYRESLSIPPSNQRKQLI